ncbi:hypothetical protein [Tenacibaculum bernardetii]|mgnify:CR=1 FL=1|uniref:hypothetical protein n=1 Tax=Tenacibaculum bernardetii TaxID=3021375 RepID=UPI0023AE87A9|nr:hypothetical protein [Tenacibaculum bernardetii]
MNYQKYNKNYPLITSKYLEWTVQDLKTSNSFNDFLEFFFSGGISIGVADEYYCILHINKPEYIQILKNKYPELYDEWREEIIINLAEKNEDAYKCGEYLLIKGYK